MRLSDFERMVIKNSIHSLDKTAKIYLFGSRTDVEKKGGDIDILVISQKLSFKDTPLICAFVFKDMEEQKIDFIMAKDPNESLFVKYIFEKAIPL
ncbi:MAG: nucleotidyltransferase domain-containing protein [Bacteroidetes bacterium]|nr:nucleotidyltransferase domain-containing protein [Bacteroidota bacterium]